MNAAEFDQLDLERIKGLVADRRQEHVSLDFKTIARADLSSRDDRRSLAEAISGFANSSGGVVVWGIDARRDEDGVDCACELRPIKGLAQFMSKLTEYSGSAAHPIVDGVVHRAIPSDAPDEGFAATLIPESDRGPHMAKLGEDRYFKRSGFSFYKMEHYDLEDMFGRRAKPMLVLEGRSVRQGITGVGRDQRYNGLVILCLRNTGRGIAKYPYLSVRVQAPRTLNTYGVDGNRGHGLKPLPVARPGEVVFGGQGDVVVHVGAALDVCSVAIEFSGEAVDIPAVHVDYEIACEGQRMERGRLTVPGEEIVHKIVSGIP